MAEGALQALERLRISTDPTDVAFRNSCEKLPTWVEWDLIDVGQKTYLRHLPICGLSLFFVSLVGGFSAPKITRVLACTGYFTASSKSIKRRIHDTGIMINDAVTGGREALEPWVCGWC